MSRLRPMKGVKVTPEDYPKLRFPRYDSLKFDGFGVLVVEGQALTTSLKPVQNLYVRAFLSQPQYEGMHGEVILKGKHTFSDIQSALTTEEGVPDFEYHVYDLWNKGSMPFTGRLEWLKNHHAFLYNSRVKMVEHHLSEDLSQLLKFGEVAVAGGYEGWMSREACAPYKFGKASINQQNILKFKPMETAECIIYGFEEGEENTNEPEENELGLTARSSAKEGMVPNGMLGKFLVWSKEFGCFKIGTGEGLTKELRQYIWDHKEEFYGKIIEFRFQRFGTIDKPRIPIYVRFRDQCTMEPELVSELLDGLLKVQEELDQQGEPKACPF